jgi:hypothetical protein
MKKVLFLILVIVSPFLSSSNSFSAAASDQKIGKIVFPARTQTVPASTIIGPDFASAKNAGYIFEPWPNVKIGDLVLVPNYKYDLVIGSVNKIINEHGGFINPRRIAVDTGERFELQFIYPERTKEIGFVSPVLSSSNSFSAAASDQKIGKIVFPARTQTVPARTVIIGPDFASAKKAGYIFGVSWPAVKIDDLVLIPNYKSELLLGKVTKLISKHGVLIDPKRIEVDTGGKYKNIFLWPEETKQIGFKPKN